MEINIQENTNLFDEHLTITPDEIDKTLVCAICQEMLKLPRECQNCHNNFCKKCIEKWLLERNDLCPFRCPGKIKLNKSHRIILDALRTLNFKCKNEINGCLAILNYDNYSNHIQNCDFNKINCTNLECKSTLLAKDLSKHLLEICKFNINKCKICGFETIGTQKTSHECAKIAMKEFNELKSDIDNFMIKVNNRIVSIDEKINKIK